MLRFLPHLLEAQRPNHDEGAGHSQGAVLRQGWDKVVELLLRQAYTLSSCTYHVLPACTP